MDITHFLNALSLFGQIVGFLGISAGVAIVIIQFWGKKWLEDRFQRGIEVTKAEHQRELEKLKHEMAQEFNRKKILHDLEFQAVPEIWASLSYIGEYLHLTLTKKPPFAFTDAMTPDDIKYFVEPFEFDDWEIGQIITATDRSERANQIFFEKRAFRLNNLSQDLVNTYNSKEIFINPQLRTNITLLTEMIGDAIEEYFGISDPANPNTRRERFLNEGLTLTNEVEREVRAYLWGQD